MHKGLGSWPTQLLFYPNSHPSRKVPPQAGQKGAAIQSIPSGEGVVTLVQPQYAFPWNFRVPRLVYFMTLPDMSAEA
jgi:hypothetical protein